MGLEIYQLLLQDLQLDNQWNVKLDDLPNSTFMVKSINLPFEQLLTETKKYGQKFYTGFTPVETLTITFFENTRFEIYEYLNNWYDTIFDREKRVFKVLTNRNDKYKNGTIAFYRPDTTITKTFALTDLQILGIDEITLDQESSEPLQWSAQFSVGNVKVVDNVLESTLDAPLNFGI